MRNERTSTGVLLSVAAGVLGCVLAATPARAQSSPPPAPGGAAAPAAPAAPATSTTPDYIIGAQDVLSITFWRDKEVSGDVVVRPDGKISLPLINDIMAAGLTVEQLRVKLTEARKEFEQDPTVSVVVRQINSKKVFITGAVGKPGEYPLTDSMTVLQLISRAGGPADFADKKNIVVVRENRGGAPETFKVNYNDFFDPKKAAKQNIYLKPGDTVIIK